MAQPLNNEIIDAAIEGFESQKRRIDDRIAELRSMRDGSSSTDHLPEPILRQGSGSLVLTPCGACEKLSSGDGQRLGEKLNLRPPPHPRDRPKSAGSVRPAGRQSRRRSGAVGRRSELRVRLPNRREECC